VEELSPNIEKEITGQGVFVGRYVHSLDNKKRLTIPSVWRAQIGDPKGLYVLPDIQHVCLLVFPAAEMVRRLQKMRNYSMADDTARRFARVLASQSDILSWDSQGRIRIKDELLAFAELVDEVVLAGAFDRFELWSPDKIGAEGTVQRAELLDAAKYVGL
jgi:MraZ protein